MVKYTGIPFYLCKDKSNYLSLFFLNQKVMHQLPKYLHHKMKQCHVLQPLCTSSTDSVTDYDNLVVKSIVIHTIPKYSLLIHKIHSKEYKKQYHETFFKSKILNWATKCHHGKLLISNAM